MRTSASPARFGLLFLALTGAMLIVAATLYGAPASIPLAFGVGAGYPTNSSFNVPFFQAVGDFNNDGAPDTVVSDGSQQLRLLLGNGGGGGGFNGPISLNVSGPCPGASCITSTNHVLAVDVNDDDNLDIVMSNNHSRNLSVILGNGNSTFQKPTNYAMGWDTRAVAVGDLNNDGKVDLIGGDSNSDIRVFIGNGDGTFGAGVSYADGAPGNPGINRQDIVVADLDNDGNNDLLVGNRDSNGGEVTVLRGHGNGTLTAWTRYGGARGDSLIVRDFNGDGWLDVAVPGHSLGDVVVRLGTGGGNLGAPTSFSTGGTFSLQLASGDFDADGDIDIVTSNQTSHNVSILQGDGAGGFSAALLMPNPANHSILSAPGQPATGDFDGDGRTDISVVSMNNDRVVVFLNNTVPPSCEAGSYLSGGSCTLAPAGSYSPGGTATAPIACAAGTYSDTAGATACTPAPAGSFVASTGATSATLCSAGSFSATTGATACTLAPAGSFVSNAGATEATLCAAGSYSDTVGSTSCTPAPAGSYVPAAGATAPIACAAGYSSNAGATECFVVDSDGDGVNDTSDAYPNSNLSATVGVGGCVTGVPNRVLENGATFNDLMATAVSGAANHGARVSAVSHLSDGWKSVGLISGRDHGAIVSCVAKSK